MKYGDICVVCFDGKIVRGVWGKVISSTQYKFTVVFPNCGEIETYTFRKERITGAYGHKRFTYGKWKDGFKVIPVNQLYSWYPSYVETIEKNTQSHMNKEGWE